MNENKNGKGHCKQNMKYETDVGIRKMKYK